MKNLLPFVLFVLALPCPAHAQVSSNKTFTIGANNVLRSNESNFFAVNGALLGQAVNSSPTLSSNLQLLSTNSNIPVWQANTAYIEGNVVIAPDTSLWEAWQSGASGSSAPSGSQAVTNGTVIWFPYGRVYDSFLPLDYPQITVGYASNYPGLTSGLQYTPYAGGLSAYASGLQYFTIEGGTNFPTAGYYDTGAAALSAPVSPSDGINNATNRAIYAGWNSFQRIHFWTTAPILGLGPLAKRGLYNGQVGGLAVDGTVVSEQSYDGLGGGPSFVVVDFHGARKMREISFYWSPSGPFPGVLVDRASTIAAAPVNYSIYVEGCSLEAGGNQAPYSLGNLWPQVLGRALGCGNIIIGAVGGTGLTNSGGFTIYPLPASNAVPDNYLGRVPLVISNSPDLVICSGDVNDIPAGGFTSASSNALFSAQTNWLKQVRSGLPKAPLVVLSLPSPAWNANETVTAPEMMQAMSNACLTFADTNVYFINALPWFTGTGCVTNALGNGNSDFYTSSDSFHPTDLAAKEIGARVARHLMNLFGGTPQTMMAKFSHFPANVNQFSGITPGDLITIGANGLPADSGTPNSALITNNYIGSVALQGNFTITNTAPVASLTLAGQTSVYNGQTWEALSTPSGFELGNAAWGSAYVFGSNGAVSGLISLTNNSLGTWGIDSNGWATLTNLTIAAPGNVAALQLVGQSMGGTSQIIASTPAGLVVGGLQLANGGGSSAGPVNVTGMNNLVLSNLTALNSSASGTNTSGQFVSTNQGNNPGFFGNGNGLTNFVMSGPGGTVAASVVTTYFFPLRGAVFTANGSGYVGTKMGYSGILSNWNMNVTTAGVATGSNLLLQLVKNGTNVPGFGLNYTNATNATLNSGTAAVAFGPTDSFAIQAIPTTGGGTFGTMLFMWETQLIKSSLP